MSKRNKKKSKARTQQSPVAAVTATPDATPAVNEPEAVPIKRSKARDRRLTKGKKKQQSQWMLGAAVLLIVAFVAFLIISNTGGDSVASSGGGSVEQTRLDLDPVLGNPQAPVTIIEYAAFGCPSCRAWHNAGVMENLLTEFAGQVRFVFRDFPVIAPAYDQMTGQIAQCALDIGNDQFWQMHNALYEQAQPGWSADSIFTLATQIGLDSNALRVCYENGTHRDTVNYDENRARSLGLPGTPSWLVNDKRVFNASPDTLRQMVLQELGG